MYRNLKHEKEASKQTIIKNINKSDRPLARLRKNNEDSNKIRNETGDNITDTTEIRRITGDTMNRYIPVNQII
jgi:hypothetical protein